MTAKRARSKGGKKPSGASRMMNVFKKAEGDTGPDVPDPRAQGGAESSPPVSGQRRAVSPTASDEVVTGSVRPLAGEYRVPQVAESVVATFDSRRPIVVGTPPPTVPTVPTAPSYRRSPYRADTVVDGWETPSVAVRATSMRGHLHRFNGAPRQDEMVIAHDDGRIVVCVADGVSAAEFAHVGAAAVCRYAAAWMEQNRHVPLDELNLNDLVGYVNFGLVQTAAQTLELAEPDPVASAAFATTLIVAVLEPVGDDAGRLTGQVVSVGDSGCWILSHGQFIALGEDKSTEDGLTSHATAALPASPESVRIRRVDLLPGDVFLVGSDGFGDPLGNGKGAVGELFRDVLTPVPPSPIHLAHALDFRRERFDDDRTLVAVYPWSGDGR